MRFIVLLGITCILSFLAACEGDDGNALTLVLRTDLVPVEEFQGVRTQLELEGREIGERDVFATLADDYIEGENVATFDGLAAGDYRLRIRLLDRESARVASRTLVVSLRQDETVAVVLGRGARSCDETACDAGQTCLGEACGTETCAAPGDPGCPEVDAECTENGDCAAAATCAVPVCVLGACFYAQGSECGDGAWCDPDLGCRSSSTSTDGGPGDAGDAGGCPALMGDCDGDPANGCETDLTDIRDCGACDNVCDPIPGAEVMCDGTCRLVCPPGTTDCDADPANGCESMTDSDPLNCGRCGDPCPTGFPFCNGGTCLASPFGSTGADGAFAPTADTILTSGVHNFTTVDIPGGVTVRADGAGVLDIRATGAIVVGGMIDVSGGAGGSAVSSGNGGGGETGTNVLGPDGAVGVCRAGGIGGVLGLGGDGTGECGEGGGSGGGAGGGSATAGGGGGGGGPAGGGGGGGGGMFGGDGGSVAGESMGGMGSVTRSGPTQGGEPTAGIYAGGPGNNCDRCDAAGGGGGSIGAAAVGDLAMATTFFPGSGGGGGGSNNFASSPGGGGGGGGGAVRLASPTSITVSITGAIRTDGGDGGSSPSAGGAGGGSGGAIFIASPSLVLAGQLSAIGGPGGASGRGVPGGAGGLGRIRLSTTEGTCSITGTLNPSAATGCSPGGGVGETFVGAYPD